MKYHITLYSSKYDNKTDKIITKRNWNQFKKFFVSASKIRLKKDDAPLISSAVFEKGTTRSNANVIAWGGWAAFDIDGGHGFASRGDVENYFRKHFGDKRYIIYSTPSCTREKIKFRAVFSLDQWITDNDEIRSFWFSMNKKLADIIDEQTKDISRMFYPPGHYQESDYRFIFWNDGKGSLNPSSVIDDIGYTPAMIIRQNKKIIDYLPKNMKREVEQYRKRQLENDGKIYVWTSYRDCPFVDRKYVEEYNAIARSGDPGRFRGFYILMASIACNAINRNYPITEIEISELIHEIDDEIDGYYSNRKVNDEIQNAISYAYRTTKNGN